MQALILAAGMGKRLGELTKDNTKCMVKVNGIPLIDRLLNQLSKLSLRRVVIVVGYEGDKLKKYVGNTYQGMEIKYIDNPVYDKTNNIYSLSLAKKEMMEDDTLLIESDLIFSDEIFSRIMKSSYSNLAVVAKYENWMDGTMVCVDEDHNIVNFVPKKAFRYEDIDLYYKTVNIYRFSKEFAKSQYIPFLEAYIHALGYNEYYEQVLRVITILDNCDLKALVLDGEPWYEIDDVQDLDIAENIFCSAGDKLDKYQKRYGGYWRFPQMLDFCYLVNPYFPTRRMIDEMTSSFDTLVRQYPSGMGVNTLLMGKYFGIRKEYVCAGNGAAELIKSLMEHLKGKVGVVSPTFEEYPNRRHEADIVTYTPSRADFRYTAADLIDFFHHQPISALLVVNPDNPSGNFLPMAELEQLIAWAAQKQIKLVIDESFVDFADVDVRCTLLSNEILEQHRHLVVIKSISKSYGVPGVRLGVLASSDETLVDILRKDVAIWNINSFGEFYMQIFGKYENDYAKACRLFIAERKRFMLMLQQVDYLRVIPSEANYFLCEVTGKYTSRQLAEKLLSDYNILIKDCSGKKGMAGKAYIRIAVRDERDNNRLAAALMQL